MLGADENKQQVRGGFRARLKLSQQRLDFVLPGSYGTGLALPCRAAVSPRQRFHWFGRASSDSDIRARLAVYLLMTAKLSIIYDKCNCPDSRISSNL